MNLRTIFLLTACRLLITDSVYLPYIAAISHHSGATVNRRLSVLSPFTDKRSLSVPPCFRAPCAVHPVPSLYRSEGPVRSNLCRPCQILRLIFLYSITSEACTEFLITIKASDARRIDGARHKAQGARPKQNKNDTP